MKKCPYCAELIQDEAILCRYCGKDLPQPPDVTESTEHVSVETEKRGRRRGFRGLIILLLIVYALWKIYDANQKERFASGIFYVTCSQCPLGVPLYDDIRPNQRIIGYVPAGEECQSKAWYDGASSRATLESQYGGSFVASPFYLVECPSGEGWIKAENRGR